MSLEADLRAYILGDVAVAALVVDRMYPLVIPQGGRQPCIVYAKQGRNVQQLFCGADGLHMTMFDIDCYATIYDDAVALANAVTARLRNFSGTMGATRVPRVFLETEFDLSDLEPGTYRQSQTWAVWHYEL